MERKSKKIVAGMMAGFSVLSTQSVLGSFQKLPMWGGCNLISYAEEGDYSNDFTLTVESTSTYEKNYKGTLQYKIKFIGNIHKRAHQINEILRNVGVTKEDLDENGQPKKDDNNQPIKTEITFADLKNTNSDNPLPIKDTSKFF